MPPAERILIVEVDPNVIQLFKGYFESEGFEVLIANNGQDAWDICRRQLPQAVVVDVNIADLDEHELLQHIRSTPRTRHIHVTFLTEQRERREKIVVLESGADDYIMKPIDIEEVRLRVRNALRRASAGIFINPATGLPGKQLIEDQLRELLRKQTDWALLSVIVKHLDEFADAYGFLAGEDVLQTTASILSETLDESGEPNDFLGHSGGDAFVIITTANVGAKLAQSLVQQLDHVTQTHYSEQERQQGFVTIRQTDGGQRRAPLMSFSVQIITAADGPFHDIIQLTSALR